MILLWGVPGDGPLDAVRETLERRAAPVRFIDQRMAAEMSVELTVDPDGRLSGCIADPDGEIDLAQVGATYLRPYETSKACGLTEINDPAYLRASGCGRTLDRLGGSVVLTGSEPSSGDGC